jgi:hypothetical protein
MATDHGSRTGSRRGLSFSDNRNAVPACAPGTVNENSRAQSEYRNMKGYNYAKAQTWQERFGSLGSPALGPVSVEFLRSSDVYPSSEHESS